MSIKPSRVTLGNSAATAKSYTVMLAEVNFIGQNIRVRIARTVGLALVSKKRTKVKRVCGGAFANVQKRVTARMSN